VLGDEYTSKTLAETNKTRHHLTDITKAARDGHVIKDGSSPYRAG
jgi:hypothetical protein